VKMKTIQARWYHRGRLRPVRLIVIHDMEWAERPSTAEDCARMFATMSRQASAHICVDSDSAVRCVADADTAWAAPGANSDGLQLEMAGFARQSRAEWLDDYSQAMLGQAAKVVATWCAKYGIPARRLTLGELKAGQKGIIGHIDASRAYGGDHTDPGGGFPWDVLLELVRAELDGKPADIEPASWTENLMTKLPDIRPGVKHKHVKTVRWLLGARGYPPRDLWSDVYAPADDDLRGRIDQFKTAHDLTPDGVWGEKCWQAALS
jgi:N-acetylmuramoyl-L-alanine amidase-like protein